MAENREGGSRGFKSRLSRAEVLLGSAETAGERRGTEETLKELHEHDIFWEDNEAQQNSIAQSKRKNCNGKSTWSNTFVEGGKRMGESAPVNVPNWPRTIKTSHDSLSDEEDEDEDEKVLVRPPHELVAHYNKNESFSVIEGNGRTLKGRDLRKVRDAVFRQTGFVD